MIINFLGDSITEGCLATRYEKSFVPLLGDILKCRVNQCGIGGSRIAKQIHPSLNPAWDLYFGSRVEELDPNADLTFVFGGTNDYGHGDAPIGKSGDKSPNTFYGAVDYLVNELLKKYKKEQIIFILPLYRINEDNPYGDGLRDKPTLPLQGYRNIISEIVKSYGIEVLDIKDQVGRPEKTQYFEDGLHPNDNGHRKIAETLANFIAKKEII